MSKKTKTAAPKKRAKQLGMGEGFERKKIEALDAAAEDLMNIVEERKSLGKQVKVLEASIATLVAEHGLKKYKYIGSDGDEFEVKAEAKNKITVRRCKKAKAKDAE